MAEQTLIEQLTDEQRIAVLLRANGDGYEEIAEFLEITPRRVRFLLAQATKSFPNVLDHRKANSSGKLMRLVYLMGYTDGSVFADSVPTDREMRDSIDYLRERAAWLKVRMERQRDLKQRLAR